VSARSGIAANACRGTRVGASGGILGRYRGSHWLGCPDQCTDAPTAVE